MTDRTAEEQLRAEVRAALTRTHLSQAEAARQLGISSKHMSQMLTGRTPLTLAWAERIVALCGARVLVCTTVPSPDRETRIRLDDLTSDDLDELYDDLDRYAEIVGELNEANTELAQRAGRAEIALADVREYAATTDHDGPRTRERILGIVGDWHGLEETGSQPGCSATAPETEPNNPTPTPAEPDWREAGCARDCSEQHTYEWGRCAQAVQPEPTVSMSKVYTDVDGERSIGFDTYTVQQLADLIEPAINEGEDGFAKPYDDNYGRWLAEKAARAIVHRNDQPAPAICDLPHNSIAEEEACNRQTPA